ncbi:hypothetical protein BGZ74_009136, partial [Mortierella antarctica]
VNGAKATKMMAGPPWVCLKLMTLSVQILVVPVDGDDEAAIREQSITIFERLSKLTQLRSLDSKILILPNLAYKGWI